MLEGSATFTNTIDQVEETTADTSWSGTKRFKHLSQVYDPVDMTDIKSATRKFILLPTGTRALPSPSFLGQEGEMTSVIQRFDLFIAYTQGKNALELFKVIIEDVDQIGRALMKVANFNTGLERRIVEAYSVDLDGQGGVALITIGVECRYTPSYT